MSGPADERAPERLTLVMKQVLLSLSRHAGPQLAEHGVTAAQAELLIKLREAGAANVAEVARRSGVDAGSATRLLDRLERKGLCTRVRSSADRRVVRVKITSLGAAAAASACGASSAALDAHLAGFTAAERRELGGYLQRMCRAGEAMRAAR